MEPLHAIYNKSIEPQLAVFLKSVNKYSIENFIKDLDVRYNNLDDSEKNKKAFMNINTPQDLNCMEIMAETKYY